jgi:hypothetical protein
MWITGKQHYFFLMDKGFGSLQRMGKPIIKHGAFQSKRTKKHSEITIA